MYTLPLEAVPQWRQVNGYHVPHAADYHCPYCDRAVTFLLADYTFDQKRNAASAASTCPGCRKQVRFWVIDPQRGGVADEGEGPVLCMYPRPRIRREPIPGLKEIPAEISKAYVSTLNVYNAREWPATAVLCRRVLEGIVKHLLPPDKQNATLAHQLTDLPGEVDLARPLKSLADVLRQGGNLGAHFDLEREPDQSTASHMVELLEYLMEYLFILPANVDTLHERMTGKVEATS